MVFRVANTGGSWGNDGAFAGLSPEGLAGVCREWSFDVMQMKGTIQTSELNCHPLIAHVGTTGQWGDLGFKAPLT